MQMIPHERSLVERLKDKPFALLGVNCDPERVPAQVVMDRYRMTWRSWWDDLGHIHRAWRVDALPAVIVLDAAGVVRYKLLDENWLDEAVDGLLNELERAKSS